MTAAPSALAVALAIAARAGDRVAALAHLASAEAAAARALIDADLPLDRAAVAAPRPPGWRRCYPSWLDDACAGLDAATRAIVLGERVDPLAVWLAQRCLGHLAPMPEPGAARSLAELPRLTARALSRTLIAIGRRQLAHAIAGASPLEQAAVARRLPWGSELGGEVAAVKTLGERAAAELGSRRAAAARTAGLTWTDPLAALAVGARAIAPAVRRIDELDRQLAQRLPRPVGLTVLAALTGPFADGGDAVGAGEIRRAIDHGSVGP